MPRVKSIHHVGIVVHNMEASLAFWRDALGIPMRELQEVATEESQVAFLPLHESDIELVQPLTADSGIARFLDRKGPGMHHICLEVDDIEAMLRQLSTSGVRLVHAQPRVRPDGTRYAFVHPEATGGVLVELYQVA